MPTTTKSNCDDIAKKLIQTARIMRNMPPSWDGAKISHLVAGPQGQYIGKGLPGKGLYVDLDLKQIGITKQLPHVYERTPFRRILDRIDRQMARRSLDPQWTERGAITTYDGIIAARAGGKAIDLSIGKASITTATNTWSSLMRVTGQPDVGTYANIPAGAAHDRASQGAWSQGLSNPSNPDKAYLLTWGYTSAAAVSMLMLVDLLVAAGNILATINTSQTVNSAALTRYTSGSGVMMIFEVTTAHGATAQNLTVTYTNQAGTGSRSTGAQASTASVIAQRLNPTNIGPYMNLQIGDYGIQSVQSAIYSAANTGGVDALNLYFPLMFVPGVAANMYMERDSTIQVDGLTELVLTAGGALGYLVGYILAGGASSGILTGFMRTVQG